MKTSAPYKRVLVKVGTTSITDAAGRPDVGAIQRVADQIVALRRKKIAVVLVTSGAIAAGIEPLGLKSRPSDMPTLQAAAAVGQRKLMDIYASMLEPHGVQVAQVLLTQFDIINRRHYLNARNTLERLVQLGCVPIVNENDTIAVEEIRYGDNDRLAALVANIVRADLMIMLSDVDGLHTSDPKRGSSELITDVNEITTELMRSARGSSDLGSGGMRSKLEAARMAMLSGIPAAIASGSQINAIVDICEGKRVGTFFHAKASKLNARKLWIAWAPTSRGRIIVDKGAVGALTAGKKSLLAAGVTGVEGTFKSGDAVEVVGPEGLAVAKGLVSFDSVVLSEIAGRKGGQEVIHRDQMVVL